MRNNALYLNNKIYGKFNGTEFVRTATANSHSSQTSIANTQPSQMDIANTQPSQMDIVTTRPSQMDTSKVTQQSVDGDKVTSCQPKAVPCLATGYLDLKFK